MDDRTLLEQAAKAAGYEFVRHSECGDGVLLAGVQDAWRPLVNDGDALRLAVKLELEVRQVHAKAHAGMIGYFWFTESYANDPYAATRRAIVRAAASLAEGTKP